MSTAITEAEAVLPNPFTHLASRSRLKRVASALERRGIHAIVAENGAQAKDLALALVPEGAEVHAALSETLAQLGITAELEESGRYDALRPKLMRMNRTTQRHEMRRLGAAPDYILGSAHAITDDGVILVGSGSGSQLGPYAYSAGHVILLVGAQKIVRDVDAGLRRLQEHSLPLEDARMKRMGMAGSRLNKILLINGDMSDRTTVILVPEVLGF